MTHSRSMLATHMDQRPCILQPLSQSQTACFLGPFRWPLPSLGQLHTKPRVCGVCRGRGSSQDSQPCVHHRSQGGTEQPPVRVGPMNSDPGPAALAQVLLELQLPRGTGKATDHEPGKAGELSGAPRLPGGELWVTGSSSLGQKEGTAFPHKHSLSSLVSKGQPKPRLSKPMPSPPGKTQLWPPGHSHIAIVWTLCHDSCCHTPGR